ncbi:MAG: PilZ domain-containing protein [Nitrospirota bacterium]
MSLPPDSHTVQPGTARPLFRVLVEFEGWGLSNSAIKGNGQTSDLTVTGCRIESSQCVSPGMHLTLRLHLPDHAGPVTVTLARVRSSQDSVFEVEFVHLPEDDQRRLKQVVEAPHEYEALSIPPAPLSPQRGPYTILVVDDAPDMRLLCATILASEGFNVLQASGSTEAREICLTHVGEIHLALVDVMLPPHDAQLMKERTSWPRVHGHMLVRNLLAKRKGLRVVLMSAYSKAKLMHNGIDLVGLKELTFLSKPFSRETLMSTIRQQMESQTPSVTR